MPPCLSCHKETDEGIVAYTETQMVFNINVNFHFEYFEKYA